LQKIELKLLKKRFKEWCESYALENLKYINAKNFDKALKLAREKAKTFQALSAFSFELPFSLNSPTANCDR